MCKKLVTSLLSPSTGIPNLLSLYLPKEIFDKIIATHIPISHIEDKLTWKFTLNTEFSTKTVTWTNNTRILPHPKTELLNTI